MVSHLDSLWNRGTRELGNGLLKPHSPFNTVLLKTTWYGVFNFNLTEKVHVSTFLLLHRNSTVVVLKIAQHELIIKAEVTFHSASWAWAIGFSLLRSAPSSAVTFYILWRFQGWGWDRVGSLFSRGARYFRGTIFWRFQTSGICLGYSSSNFTRLYGHSNSFHLGWQLFQTVFGRTKHPRWHSEFIQNYDGITNVVEIKKYQLDFCQELVRNQHR